MLVQGSGGGFAPTTAKAASGGSAPPSYAPIITLALQLAKAAQLPQTQAIHNAQAQSDAAARAQAASISGYTAALAPILAHIAPAVQQGYTQAAGLDALLGKGFGNDLGTDQGAANSQAQSILNNSGGQAQLGGVQQAIGGQGVQNALGFLNGGLPAQGLNQAGAAFGAAAKTLPAAFAGQGQQELGSLAAKQQLADQGFGQKLTDLAAQLPGLVLKNENTLQTQQALQDYHNAQLSINEQRAKDTAAYQRGELTARQYANKISASRAAETVAHNKATEALAGQRNAITQQKDVVSERQAQQRLKIQQQRETIAAKKAKQVLKKAKITGGATPGERLTLLNRANKMAEDFFYGVPATTTKPAVAPVYYLDALRHLEAIGLRRVDAMRLLNVYYAPGEGGRPVTNNIPEVNPLAAGPTFP